MPTGHVLTDSSCADSNEFADSSQITALCANIAETLRPLKLV